MKKILTSVLLLFVAVSVAVLILKEGPKETARSAVSSVGGAEATAETADDEGRGRRVNPPSENRVMVYYFHGNVRCPTCLTLEAYSKETVETRFADELRDGRLIWEVVNFDEQWNDHFIRQYDLAFQSLVIVKVRGGKEVEFKNLEEIWSLVGDKEAYVEYVTREARSYLEGI